MRSCEDFGMFDTCAYFAARDYDVVVAAASAFKSITRGENSSIESSAVNVWSDKEDVGYIKDYLMRFYHPEFLTVLDEKHKYPTTATMLVSGKEMAYQMAMPKKSVSGIPIVECTEFAREIVSLNEGIEDVPLGKIFHMHSEEATEVALNAKNMTAHTFITGSTGSGKSTTIYKILDELNGMPIEDSDETVKFMVIEPAKGEYKNALAKNKKFDIKVYDVVTSDFQQLRNRINVAIRIIESGMVEKAMEYVLERNDNNMDCAESKVNAQYLLDCLKRGESVLPEFED